jgi:quercetin dioxygenase-like cupin family protein
MDTAISHERADALWFGDTSIVIRVSAADGDGICVVEHEMPFGDAPPLHIHRNEDEIFHILHGALRLRIGDHERIARRGETLRAPKGVPHAYRVESLEGARVLTITRGADFEGMLRAAGRPPSFAGLPVPVPIDSAMAAGLAEICARHAIEIVGPPLA